MMQDRVTNSRGISLRVLAQHFAAERSSGARCKNEPELWDQAEEGYLAAKTRAAANAAAAPAWELCLECPLLYSGECFTWAEEDRYTGLAAGLGWAKGVARKSKYGRAVNKKAS